jgi:autotransporter-associated beta strand protein
MALPNGSTYLPGSWADDLTSYGCDFPDTSQTKSTALIAAGASGTTGSVTEPYAISERFTNSDIYTFIADGCTFGEALAKSLAAPDIQMPLGDMLAQPCADVPKATFTSSPGNYGVAKGTISIGASAALAFNTPCATGISKLELVIDGLVSSSGTLAGGSGAFNLNTAALSDGVHEVRIVAINNSEAASEGYVAQEIVVNNHGRSVNFNGGNTTMTSTAATFGLATAAGDGTVSQLELTCLGRVVGSGSPGSLSVSLTGLLAPGDNTIVPVAVFSDGSQVAGGAFVVHEESGSINTWGNGAATGLWSNRLNWTGGTLPQNGDNIARFGGSASGGTVTVDASASVEEIDFSNSGGGNYTIAASAGQTLTLALSTTNSPASECMVNVLSGSHTISAPLILAAQGNLMNVTNPTDFLNVSGSVGGIGGLTKTGSGTLVLAGSNTYAGATRITAGTLQATMFGSLPIYTSSTSLSVASGAMLAVNVGGAGEWTSAGLAGLMGNGGAFSAGAWLGIDTGDAGGAFACSSNVASNVNFNKIGAGTLIFSGSNTFTGAVVASAGALQFNSAAAMGSVNATLVNGAAATAGYPIDQTFLGHISSASTGTVALAVSSSNNLNFSSAGLSHVSLGAVGAATFSGMLTPAGSTYSLGGGGGTLTFASSLGGSSGLVVTGPGTVVLTASNTYGGGTTVSSGTLQAKTPGALPSYASSHSLSVAPGAVLSVNVGGTGEWTTGNLDSLLGNSTAFPAGSAIGIDTSDANGAFTYSSNINGNVGLCKFGAGTLVLTGSSGYAGATTVAVGTLNVGGQLTASEVSVQSGAVLTGSGAVSSIVLNTGSTLAPGNNGSGVMTVAALTLNYGAILNCTLGSGADGTVAVSDGISLCNGLVVNVSPGANWGVGMYPLFSMASFSFAASTTIDAAWTVAGVDLGGRSYSIVGVGNNIDLSVPAVNAQSLVGSASTYSWASTATWQGGMAPTLRGDTAAFNALSGSGSATITLDGSRTLSGLSFSATGGGGYVLSRTDSVSSLALANNGIPVPVSVTAGSAAIAVPVVLGDNLSISVGSGAIAAISGPISENGGSHSLTLSGSGTLILSGSNDYSGGTTVTGGTLNVNSAQALPTTGMLVVGRNGRVVLGNITGAAEMVAASPLTSESISLASTPAVSSIDSSAAVQTSSLATAAVQVSVPVGAPLSGGPAAVPEPGTVLLLLVGAAALAVWRRRK